MMSFLTYITGFFMNFELLPILTDYAQGSFQQSLVEIGSVVSEEKIFFLISSLLFSNLHNRSKWVNLITHLGVIALFSSIFFSF
jgi:hypothetical protein